MFETVFWTQFWTQITKKGTIEPLFGHVWTQFWTQFFFVFESQTKFGKRKTILFAMKTKFYLRESKKLATIYFEYRLGVQKIRLSTGFVLKNSKEWDDRKEMVKIPASAPDAPRINHKISIFLNELQKLVLQKNNEAPSIQEVTILFEHVFEKQRVATGKTEETQTQQTDFLSFYSTFIKNASSFISPSTHQRLSEGTIKNYRNSYNRLNDYLIEKNIERFEFNHFDKNFYNDFKTFMSVKGYSKNYIGSCLQKLKSVMSMAFDQKLHTNTEYRFNKAFSKLAEQVDLPYLTKEEIERIATIQLTTSREKRARDIFLMGCYTGLRIGDLLRILKDGVEVKVQNGVKYFEVYQSKTNELHFVPILPSLQQLLDRLDGKFPEYLHQVQVNICIKEIARKAGITEMYEFQRTEGGKMVKIKAPKFLHISTHTARRSFCTNLFKDEVPIHNIMALSGHKSEAVFRNYVKIGKLDNITRVVLGMGN